MGWLVLRAEPPRALPRSSALGPTHFSNAHMKPDSGSRITPPKVYYYRRELEKAETLTAAGIAVGAGIAAFYLARLLLQRTPLAREVAVPQLDDRGVIVRRVRPKRSETLARR